MKPTMPQFSRAKVLVVGDIMLDRYWVGPTSRISPEAPVPVVNVQQHEDRPGGAANVALNMAALGVDVTLSAITGEDDHAESLKRSLQAVSINNQLHTSQTAPTITKLRVMSRHQQLLRLDFELRFDEQDALALQNQFDELLETAAVVVLSDYGKGSIIDHQFYIERARAKNVPVLADPKGSDFSIYQGATLITPNLSEFEAVVGECADDEALVSKGLALLKDLSLGALLVTRGEKGMTLLREGEPALHLPARAREVFDVTGAGDTVISVLAAAIASGEPIPESTALANIAAGLVVAKVGTATVSVPELRREVNRELGSERGVVSPQQLMTAIEDARAHGEKIVFTNGCFDIIHAGHVAYLEEARALGDRLVLAVNSDASVKRLKGEGRPINSESRRAAVLAALESVDWVVVFEDDTPIPLLEQIKPDVLVKGGDYRINEVVGADLVNQQGGDVKVLAFVDEVSTTAIVKKIREEEID